MSIYIVHVLYVKETLRTLFFFFVAVVESYELTGRHTYLAMAIIAGCALVLLLSLAALYKKLAPKSNFILPAAVNATSSQVAATELESTGIRIMIFFQSTLNTCIQLLFYSHSHTHSHTFSHSQLTLTLTATHLHVATHFTTLSH